MLETSNPSTCAVHRSWGFALNSPHSRPRGVTSARYSTCLDLSGRYSLDHRTHGHRPARRAVDKSSASQHSAGAHGLRDTLITQCRSKQQLMKSLKQTTRARGIVSSKNPYRSTATIGSSRSVPLKGWSCNAGVKLFVELVFVLSWPQSSLACCDTAR